MKIYIASRTSQRKEVKKLYKQFIERGYEVLDWTWHKNTRPYHENLERAKNYSVEDINWIKECDIFILLTHKIPGSGSTTELGAAILANRLFGKPHIYVVGKENDTNMFYYHPTVSIKQDIGEVFKAIKILKL